MSGDFEVWKKVVIRAIILMGFTFFSNLVVNNTGFLTKLLSAAIVGGLYLFTELMRYYNIKPTDKKKFCPLIY